MLHNVILNESYEHTCTNKKIGVIQQSDCGLIKQSVSGSTPKVHYH